MTIKDVLWQLESLRENSADFARAEDADPIWQQDIDALDETECWPRCVRLALIRCRTPKQWQGITLRCFGSAGQGVPSIARSAGTATRLTTDTVNGAGRISARYGIPSCRR